MGSLYPWMLSAETVDWCRISTSPLTALRMVLAITLERDTAAACMGESGDDVISYWPSTLYGVLATQAASSAQTWHLCALAIDESLGGTGKHYQSLSPARLARLFHESGHLLDTREVAALLWALLKQREPAGSRIAGRLGAEFEMLALQRPADVAAKAHADSAHVQYSHPLPGCVSTRFRRRPTIGSSRH